MFADWGVSVYTSKRNYAGTAGRRKIKVYGSNDKTDSISFSGSVSRGKLESTSTYMDIREPYKIEVIHVGKGMNPAWRLHKVRKVLLYTKS